MKALTDSGKEAVRQAMLALPRNEHLAVILFYDECMTKAEVAATLEVNESEVTTLLNRARTKLRRALHGAERRKEAKAEEDDQPDQNPGSD